MTNGEKIQKDFKGCEVCEPIVEDDIIHVIFADKKDSAIGFDLSWWNAEYKEPTTKNDLGVDCISRDSAIKALDYDIKCFEFKRGVNRHMDDIAKLLNTIYETQVNNIKALPSTPQEPKIIPIAEIKFDEDKLKELVNKAVLTVTQQEPCEDTISRKSIKQKLQEHHDFFVNAYGGFSNLPLNDKSRVDEITNCIAMVVNEPSVTPRKPQTFKWCTDCKEYDQEKHCCPRWSKVIRSTVEEMKQEYIEREVLDKIRAELHATAELHEDGGYCIRDEWIDEYFDKYKAETEDKA